MQQTWPVPHRNKQASISSALPTLPPLPLIIPLSAILPLDPLDPLPPALPSHRPTLTAQAVLLPLNGIVIQLDQPVRLPGFILALVPPFFDPLTLFLIVDEILAAVLEHGAALGAARELADALLARELLPRRRLLGLRQGFPARERRRGRWERHRHAVRRGCYGACGEQGRQEGLGPVPRNGLECAVASRGRLGEETRGAGERVGVCGHQIAQVECVGCGLVDCDGTKGGRTL